MFCESTTERDVLIDLEFDRCVLAYRTQPASFGYTIRGRKRRYTPDLLVLDRQTGFRYEEIKTPADSEAPKFQQRFAHLQWLFHKKLQVPLELRIGRAPGTETRTANRRRLYGYLQHPVDEAWLRVLPSAGTSIRYDEAVQRLVDSGGSAACVLALIAHGWLDFDVFTPLAHHTVLEVSHG